MLAILIATLAAATHALDIAVPTSVAAGQPIQVTFDGSNSDTYRVYLAATLTGVNGPTCYLDNSTSLSSPLTISIPADVGPSADYYSIAITDLTTTGNVIYSNRFALTGATGVYSDYESQLGGAPFWDANDLPCAAYSCARSCASASYPDDLTQVAAYDTMKSCILACPDVSPAPSQTAPAHLAAASAISPAADVALITLASGAVVTAVPTTVVQGGSTITEAILDGSLTITLGASAATFSGVTASLATDGVAVDGTTTVPFATDATASATSTTLVAGTATKPRASASSHAAAARHEATLVGLLGLAGAAVLVL